MRSVADILGAPGFVAQETRSSGATTVQPNSEPLGALTGAPPRTIFTSIQVAPFAVGPTLISGPERYARLVAITAPLVGFSIFVGGPGVKISDLALPPGLPYQIQLIGFQELYAVTDSPAYMQIRVQIAPLLIGDRERRY